MSDARHRPESKRSRKEVKQAKHEPRFNERLATHDLEIIIEEEAKQPAEYLRSYDS